MSSDQKEVNVSKKTTIKSKNLLSLKIGIPVRTSAQKGTHKHKKPFRCQNIIDMHRSFNAWDCKLKSS